MMVMTMRRTPQFNTPEIIMWVRKCPPESSGLVSEPYKNKDRKLVHRLQLGKGCGQEKKKHKEYSTILSTAHHVNNACT